MPFVKGHPPYLLRHTKETRKKMSEVQGGRRKKISELLKLAYKEGRRKPVLLLGKSNPFYGKSHSDSTRKKISDAKKGKSPAWNKGTKGLMSAWNKGKKLPYPVWNKGKKIPQQSGEKHWAWIADRTVAMNKHRLRSTLDWKNWRSRVFDRDKYTCRECGARGVYLESHHIVPVKVVGLDSELLFKLENGITLCRPCHKKTMGKESNFEKKYLKMVAQV